MLKTAPARSAIMLSVIDMLSQLLCWLGHQGAEKLGEEGIAELSRHFISRTQSCLSNQQCALLAYRVYVWTAVSTEG